MPRYYDSKGKAHILAAEIGRGGEGTVYFCKENDELVAKIYHEPITDEKAKKLQLMANNKNERLLKVAAWVVETLHDKPGGKVVGFLMPSIRAKEIHELYSLKSRRRHFPQATWHYLIHTSTNLARAFYSLHKYKHVIGDVNHGNCVVLADGTVKLIDCDSYAISDGENRFACEVGVATHLAPELQKANLSEVERKPEHDNFALAVVIFQLLFLGRHPFAGNYLGEKDKTLEDCISEFRFAYGKNAKQLNVRQPPGTLNLDEVSPRIANLFERAFDEKSDNRPTPREWIEALVDLSENLFQCGINPGHRFFNDLVSCPWCRIESQTGLMLFPFVFNEEQTDGETPFNIFTVEKLIENLGSVRNLPAKLEKPSVLAKPAPANEIVESAVLNRNHQFLFVGGYFVGLVFLTLIFGLVAGTILGIFLMIYLFTTLSNDNKELQQTLMQKLSQAESKWNSVEKEFSLLASPKMFAGDIDQIKREVAEYKKLQAETRKDIKILEKEHKHRKFTNYLRTFRIQNTEIEGISENVRSELVGKNVWTAAEIDEERLRKDYGVNLYVRKKLVKWRKGLEKSYVYKADADNLEEKKKTFLDGRERQRHQIENRIESSLESVRKRSMNVEKNQKLLIPKSEKIAKEVSQCKSNLSAVGDTSVALASLILITVLVPFFGGIVSEMSSSNVRTGTDYETNESYDIYDGSAKEIVSDNDLTTENTDDFFAHGDEVLTDEQANGLTIPNKEITDEEITELGEYTRKELSDNLVRQAIHIVKNIETKDKTKDIDEKLKESREKLKLAIRVKKGNIRAFEEFGITLYNRGFYKESTAYFIELEKLAESNNITQNYLGMNYLRLKDFKRAKNILQNVVKTDSVAHFNLALAYKGLKEYNSAEGALKKSLDFHPNDADTHYELGYVYFKLNKKEEFNKQYAKLLELDSDKAKKLLDNSYKLPPGEGELKKIRRSDLATDAPPPPAPPLNPDTPTIKGEGTY